MGLGCPAERSGRLVTERFCQRQESLVVVPHDACRVDHSWVDTPPVGACVPWDPFTASCCMRKLQVWLAIALRRRQELIRGYCAGFPDIGQVRRQSMSSAPV